MGQGFVTARRDLQEELDLLAAAALGRAAATGPRSDGGDESAVADLLVHARRFAPVDSMDPETRRGRSIKQFAFRFSRLFLSRQASYNVVLADAVTMLNQQMAALRSKVTTDGARLAAQASSISRDLERFDRELDAGIQRLNRELDARDVMRDEFTAFAQNTQIARDSLRSQVAVLRSELDMMVDDLRKTLPPGVDEKTILALSDASDSRADAFYERFEDVFRGSRDDIRSALTTYIELLQDRLVVSGDIVDLGCGRGEWLELLRENGYSSVGVDTNDVAVALCLERGLTAVKSDCLSYLRGLPSESISAVTSFHLVEHMPIEQQLELIEQSFRVLKPGGLLIIETPNPTNVTVGAAAFYMDPTHHRPVHPTALAFMLRDAGFVAVETRFLHPRENYRPDENPSSPTDLTNELMWSIRGPQDYAVFGRRTADPARERS